MWVEIIKHDPNPTEKICELTEICYPYIEVKKLNKNELNRLIRKFVRQRDMILQSVHILFEFRCPLFVLNDLKLHLNELKFANFDYMFDNICFDTPKSFSDKHKSQIACLYKKVSSVLKSIQKDNLTDEDITYILPMSYMVKFNAYLDFLEIYDMVTCIIKSKVHSKTLELGNGVFELVSGEFPQFFTKQNLEIFLVNDQK